MSVQEQRGELELTAFVLHSVSETTALSDAVRLRPHHLAQLSALLRDDRGGICLIIQLLQQQQKREDSVSDWRSAWRARRCRSVDELLHNRVAVRTIVSELLQRLQVILSDSVVN